MSAKLKQELKSTLVSVLEEKIVRTQKHLFLERKATPKKPKKTDPVGFEPTIFSYQLLIKEKFSTVALEG